MTTTLDTLVATAMGAPACETAADAESVKSGPFTVPWHVPPDGRPRVLIWEAPLGQALKCMRPFSPSTNIAHAHMFRDKVLRNNPGWRAVAVASQSMNADNGMWFYVDVKDVTGRFISESGTHSTEPTALCLALLRACGVSEEKIKEAMDGK